VVLLLVVKFVFPLSPNEKPSQMQELAAFSPSEKMQFCKSLQTEGAAPLTRIK